ncbi:MAG: D-alanyl-D-alanine carboxypeptidase, partial [Bacteroidaceae bacterium]
MRFIISRKIRVAIYIAILSISFVWADGGDKSKLSTSTFKKDSIALDSKIQRLIASLPIQSDVGICFYDLDQHRMLYTHRDQKMARPASTMKLLTSITSLAGKSKDIPFQTTMFRTGIVRNDTLFGDIYLKGGADPTFDSSDMDSMLDSLLAGDTFHAIKGELYGDVSLTDSLYWRSGWLWDDNPAEYQAYLSPLMYQEGRLSVRASPGMMGQPAKLDIYPNDAVYTVINKTRTTTRRTSKKGMKLTRQWLRNGNIFEISGDIYTPVSAELNVFSPQDYCMMSLVSKLEQRGISMLNNRVSKDSNIEEAMYKSTVSVDALTSSEIDSISSIEAKSIEIPYTEVPLGEGYSFGEVPLINEDSTLVCVSTITTSFYTVLKEMLKESDNLYAESMLTHLAQITSGKNYKLETKDGLKAIISLLQAINVNKNEYIITDGCGLSSYDYVSPKLLTQLLIYAYNDTHIFASLYKALPVSGIDGTMKYRFGRGKVGYRRVHAKTGTVTAASCLSGYLTTN